MESGYTLNSGDLPRETALFVPGKFMAAIIAVMAEGEQLEASLRQVCQEIECATVTGNYVFARITFDGKLYFGANFQETATVVQRNFQLPDGKMGLVELNLTHQSVSPDTSIRLGEANSALDLIVPLLVGLISKFQLGALSIDIGERQKELKGINFTSEILGKGKSLEESLQVICNILPESWQYPESTVSRIRYNKMGF